MGLKQGCNLSPALFNIFVNDIISNMNNIENDAPYLGTNQISCLSYADDLVLLSESKEGLQKSIDNLNSYSNKWFLEVNFKKTKCLTFSKGRKNKAHDYFKLGEQTIENCESYCYLGVIFCRSGSMKMASKALYDKAYGAMFSLLRNINKHNACKIDILIELFDKMILPIAFYNSEVWGTDYIPTNRKNNNLFDMQLLSKQLPDKLQIRYLKMILGLSASTSNFGTLSETGKFPVVIRIFTFMIKYLFHLKYSASPIIKDALAISHDLSNKGVKTWFSGIRRILKFCQLEYLYYTCDTKEIEFQLKNLEKKLKLIFINKWKDFRHEIQEKNNRLSNFMKDKEEFEISKYSKCVKIGKHRIALSKLRLGSHGLPVETGIYEQIPKQERFCKIGCNTVGDECHYLFQCNHPFIKDQRLNFMQHLFQIEPECGFMNDQEKLTCLFNYESSDLHNRFGKYAFNIINTFKELTG